MIMSSSLHDLDIIIFLPCFFFIILDFSLIKVQCSPHKMADSQVCIQFRNYGTCRLDDCKREHSAGEKIIPAKPNPRYPRIACKNVEGGNTCPRGRFCLYYHSEEDKKREIPQICQNYRRNRCIYGDKCPREHIDVQPEERRPLDCIRWVKTGDCSASVNCIYVHDDAKKGQGFPEGEEPKPRINRRNGRRGPGRGPRRGPRRAPRSTNTTTNGASVEGTTSAPKQTRPPRRNGAAAGGVPRPRGRGRRVRRVRNDTCYKFREGNCPSGDQCPFKHGDNDTRDRSQFARPPAAPRNEICFKFKAGNCQRDNCPYQHDANAPDPSTNRA